MSPSEGFPPETDQTTATEVGCSSYTNRHRRSIIGSPSHGVKQKTEMKNSEAEEIRESNDFTCNEHGGVEEGGHKLTEPLRFSAEARTLIVSNAWA